MAATVLIYEWNGTSGSQASTDKTSGNVRYKKADNSTVDNVNPLVKPTAGSDRSYEKWLRMHIGATGPTGSLTNPKFFTSGSPGAGATVYIRTTNPGAYATPAIPANDTAGTDATTYVTGSRKAMDTVNAGPYTGTNTDIADFAVLWMTIGTTVAAPQNPTTSTTLNFAYDET